MGIQAAIGHTPPRPARVGDDWVPRRRLLLDMAVNGGVTVCLRPTREGAPTYERGTSQ